MSSIKIEGGIPLRGEVNPMPNKNSILKIIPACVLAENPVTLNNVPKSSSVRVMLRIFRSLGGKVSYLGNSSVRLNGATVDRYVVSEDLAKQERAGFLFLGPLLARFGKAEIGDSGGCKLGNRPLDAMFQGLGDLGVQIDQDNGYKMEAKKLVGNEKIWLVEASVTGTETIILAAIRAQGRTVIYNAACEPHTQDLCNFLVSLGAKIKGIGSNKLEIEGVDSLSGGEWTIIPDHIDIAGYIAAAAITGGEILIKDAIPDHMTQILNYFKKLNVVVDIKGQDLFVPGNQKLRCQKNVKGNIDKIMDQPWPGYPVDLIPQAVVLAMMSEGTIKIFGNMYETQLLFISELLKIKADIMLADSHQIISYGPSKLVGTVVDATSILQCAHAIVLAGLAASGTTVIRNAEIVSRRYPEIVKILKGLGAKIEIGR
ncbi:MAG: UDP-N-acetylglucosamine 1-carboxyvinyltransferase [Candidatus Dojkabacteria bacterium]|nr:UDP-N-acetylglucosamine 1-carboxyvinyltransferase [Candidatus Dojkabacteria bacterium]